MEGHVTATINDLRDRRAAKAAELACLDDLIHSLQAHFNGATAEKPTQARGRPPKTVCSPTPAQSSPIVAPVDTAAGLCGYEGPQGLKCHLMAGHSYGKHAGAKAGGMTIYWADDWDADPAKQVQTEANIAIGTALEVKQAAAKPVEVPRVWAEGSNEGVTACSPEGVRIGATLVEPFSSTDLQARLDGESAARAYQWIAAWKAKGWVHTVAFGIYKRGPKWPSPSP